MATPVNKEEVRMLVASIGYQDAAKRTGISPNTLYQWARRFQWNTPIPHVQQTVRTVRKPADALADELAENERETRLALSKHAKHAISAINKSVHPAKWTKEAKEIAQTAGIVHRWGDNEKATNSFTLNVLNINALESDAGPTTLDVE